MSKENDKRMILETGNNVEGLEFNNISNGDSLSVQENITQEYSKWKRPFDILTELKGSIAKFQAEYGRCDGKGEHIDGFNRDVDSVIDELKKNALIDEFFCKYDIPITYRKYFLELYDDVVKNINYSTKNYHIDLKLSKERIIELVMLTTYYTCENVGDNVEIQPMKSPVDIVKVAKMIDGENYETIDAVVEARTIKSTIAITKKDLNDNVEEIAIKLAKELNEYIQNTYKDDIIFCPYQIAYHQFRTVPDDKLCVIFRYGIYDNWEDGCEPLCKHGGNKNKMKS